MRKKISLPSKLNFRAIDDVTSFNLQSYSILVSQFISSHILLDLISLSLSLSLSHTHTHSLRHISTHTSFYYFLVCSIFFLTVRFFQCKINLLMQKGSFAILVNKHRGSTLNNSFFGSVRPSIIIFVSFPTSLTFVVNLPLGV